MARPQAVSNDTKIMPIALEAEQALLGAILLDNKALEVVEHILKPEHFYEHIHTRIYEAVTTLAAQGRVANPVTLQGVLTDIDLGGLTMGQYIARLLSNASSVTLAPEYARTILSTWTRRKMISIAEQMMAQAYDAPIDKPVEVLLSEAEVAITDLSTEGVEACSKSSGELAAGTVAKLDKAFTTGKAIGVECGIPEVQELIGPMMPGDLIVIGGGTSMGKTAVSQQMAMNVAKAGKTVLIFSIEMEPEHFNERYLANEAGVASEAIENAYLNAAERDRVREAAARLAELPLHIVGLQDLTVPMMLAEARRLKRKHGLSLILIDHLQFITPVQRFRSDAEGIASNVRLVKQMAKRLGVPVLLLSHLNREYAKEDRKPTVSDLYGSGAIEKDADIVMFVHREERALAAKEPSPSSSGYQKWWDAFKAAEGKAEVILGKRRRGKGYGKRIMRFDGKTTTFSPISDPGTLL